MRSVYQKNLLVNRNEIARGSTELASKPSGLVVVLTTRCNIDCIMCNVKGMQWELPERTVKDIIALFPYLDKVSWQGGEVFLYRRFRDILREAVRYPSIVHSITTNGLFLNDEWLDFFNRIRIDLNISIDATSKTVYEQIRKGSKFEKVIANLERIRKRGINGRYNLVVTVMRRNYDKLDHFVKFADEYGFATILFQQARTEPGSRDNEFIFKKNNRSVNAYLGKKMQQLRKEAASKNINLIDALTSKPGKKSLRPARELFCNAPWKQLFIGWEGYVHPSCLCVGEEIGKNAVGNVRSESLQKIWNGRKMREYRRRIRQNRFQGLCNLSCVNGTIPKEIRNVSDE